jgi:predicted ATPase
MITRLNIKNFKSHSRTELDLSCLNILSGLNGTGKSSVFQALLLLRQSYLKNRLDEGIDLNKPLCHIGSVKDALYQYAEDDLIEFELKTEQQALSCLFQAHELGSTFLDCTNKIHLPDLNRINLFNRNFQYLSAARLSPQETYPKDTYSVEKERQLSSEMGKCELIAHFLHYYGKKEKIRFENLKHPGTRFDDLFSQTNAWTAEISPNINVIVKDNEKNFEIGYQFNLEGGEFPTNEFRAENTGFGISYSLPIIVAILAAEKDAVLLIENPESHLHPRGQSKLAELAALAAQNGVQIFMETHSDHIINGTLVAVKKYGTGGKGISHDKVRIWYFDRDETCHATRAEEVPVLEGGRIMHPPKGFFDQFKMDIKTLMGF